MEICRKPLHSRMNPSRVALYALTPYIRPRNLNKPTKDMEITFDRTYTGMICKILQPRLTSMIIKILVQIFANSLGSYANRPMAAHAPPAIITTPINMLSDSQP